MNVKRAFGMLLVVVMIVTLLQVPVIENIVRNLNPISVARGNGENNLTEYVEGEAIVGFYGPMAFFNTQVADVIATKYDITKKDTNPELSAVLYQNVDNETLSQLGNDTNIKYVERNYNVDLSLTPNDPSWSFQYGPLSIDGPTAWDTVTGSSTFTVAVVDTGIDYNHPDLSANYQSGGYDWVNDDNDPIDDHGHGTHVAGILGAVGNNNLGMAGMAWQIKMIAEKVFDETGSGNTWAVSRAIVHAVIREARIISMSLMSSPTETLEASVQFAFNQGRLLVAASGNFALQEIFYPARYQEVIAVGAIDDNDNIAGFSHTGPEQELVAPGVEIISFLLRQDYFEGEIIYRDFDTNGVVSVNDRRLNHIPGTFLLANTAVASNDLDEIAQWDLIDFNTNEMHAENINANNQYDDTEHIYADLDIDSVVSVGDMRLSGFWVGLDFYGSGSIVRAFDPDINDPLVVFNANERHTTVAFWSGTSMAVPHVTGVAALTWIRNPDLSRDELRCLLRNTADDLGTTGHDNIFGYGKVDASQSVIDGQFRYSIDVTPTAQTIAPGDSVDYDVEVSLIQAPSQNIVLSLDQMYLPNTDLTTNLAPSSGTPPFTAILTLTASQTAAFLPETLRITGTHSPAGCDFVCFSNFFSIDTTPAPGDLIWIKTSETDDGSTPRSGALYLSPDIWSSPDPPETGKTNTLYVKVRNRGSTDSGEVLVRTWFTDFNPFTNVLNLPSLGPEIISNIPPGGERTASFSWVLPSTFPTHICVFAQAWRPGFESFTNQFDVANNNNIGQRNFEAVTSSSPYSTTLRIRNPTNHSISLTLYATAPNTDWIVDICRASTLNETMMVTPLKIPPGEELELELTIIPPEGYDTGTIYIWASIDDYQNVYTDLSGFAFEVRKPPPDDRWELLLLIILAVVIVSVLLIMAIIMKGRKKS